MRKLLAALVLVVVVGCGSTTKTDTPQAHSLFVSIVQDKYPDLSAKDIVKMGDLSCELLDTTKGDSDRIAMLVVDMGLSKVQVNQLAYIMAGASRLVCPEWAGFTG